jgi:hypothetical protein
MRRQWAFKAALALALIPVLAALFARLLTLAFALPDAQIVEAILERPSVVVDRRADNGRIIDADTECIGLSVGVYRADALARSNLDRAMRAESLYGCDQLMHWLETGKTNRDQVYARYWHGYQIVMRPLLSVMPYNDMRGLLFAASLIALAALLLRAGKDFGTAAGIAIAAPFFIVNAMGLMVVATKAPTLLLAILGALLVFRRREEEAPLLIFFGLGALTAFFDFLTAPALVGSLALFFHALAERREGRSDSLARAGALGGFFILGWAGLLVAKFVIAELILGAGAFAHSFDAGLARLRAPDATIESFLPGAALIANFKALKSVWLVAALVIFIVAPLARADARRRLMAEARRPSALLIAALAPIIWLEVFSNHSQIHAAFTQVNLIPLFALSGLALAGCKWVGRAG